MNLSKNFLMPAALVCFIIAFISGLVYGLIFIESSLPLPLGISDHILNLFGLCSLITLILGISGYAVAKKAAQQPQIKQSDYSKWLYTGFAILVIIFSYLYFFSDWFIQKGFFGLGGH